ncbi:hypothetical protein DU80_17895 [Methanosarcina mazei]|uniref:Uncharacterized protein n=1 Tax=Methanosarcina mazei TaxID=2209 RepID=A0A0F8JGI6_METMZ|nr:hypothetical protein DU47_14245 [Methanosarcina mazei]KKG50765.1 hypothetical protein DU33_08460 [Methanosarcina mazei]KKG74853.1 hypothetical protein DU63_04580 [Methanosarcina mazei]KKH07877.1 hypothetical protein DU42_02110 [Methanosarcina mazei]KKH62581.1 hypothetical protein DU74_07905 [Methanosarcina mazei]
MPGLRFMKTENGSLWTPRTDPTTMMTVQNWYLQILPKKAMTNTVTVRIRLWKSGITIMISIS